MYTITFIAIFMLGTVIGSFLNVVIYRFNTGKSITRGRSICMSCNQTLRWYELIPVFSFLIQSGRCRRCASYISHQYILVEIWNGILFSIASYYFLPILTYSQPYYVFLLAMFMFTFSILTVIAVYDMRHKIIPDTFVYTFIFLSFIFLFINHTGSGSLLTAPSFGHFFAGPLLALPFGLIWLFSKGTFMGLGDAKLILGIGWILGFSKGLSALVLSFWIGSVMSIIMLLASQNKLNMKSEIPFAPFLILGMLIAFFFNLDIFSIASIFSL